MRGAGLTGDRGEGPLNGHPESNHIEIDLVDWTRRVGSGDGTNDRIAIGRTSQIVEIGVFERVVGWRDRVGVAVLAAGTLSGEAAGTVGAGYRGMSNTWFDPIAVVVM